MKKKMMTPSARKTANVFVENEDEVEPWRRSAEMELFNVVEACSDCATKGGLSASWSRCMVQRRPHQPPRIRRLKGNEVQLVGETLYCTILGCCLFQ